MKDKNIFRWSDDKIYLIVSALMTIVIGAYQPVLGLISAICFSYLVYYSFTHANEKNQNVKKSIEHLSETFESATKHAIFNMPFPLVIIDEKGSINWYNTPFLDMIIEDEILNERIYDVIPNFSLENLLNMEEGKGIDIKYGDKHYLVYPNIISSRKSSNSGEKIIILYWVHNTEYINLEQKYKDEKTIVSLVYVDNYDDVKSGTPDINRPLLLAEIDKKISEYFSKYEALVRKYENDKYIVIMNNEALEDIQEKKFDLLDDVRDLKIGNKIPITLSMGVSDTDDSLIQSHENAKAAIDIALGRGGDQAVLNKEGTYEFYGGKSQALEKRNKVKARVIGYALRQLIDQTDSVFIMGHKNPDMDSFGASIGVLRGVQNRNKKGYIVLKGENPSIKNIFEKLRKEQPELLDYIITPAKAETLIDNDDSLMILVDNHKPSFTEAPELLELVSKVVVIDHHRRGAEFVKDPVLVYLEPYASSASELVTEILSYMSDNINLTKFEAEALLSGITVDTKNFSFQTGVRTFEAASILKRSGADTTSVRQLFRDEFDTFIYRAEVIRSSRIIYDKIAIGKLEIESDDSLLIAAQSANELLDINGVEASFVLTYANDRIHISGRSLGNISVQLILEDLGGGGHLTSAGTQILGVGIDAAEEMLIETIEKHLKEGD